ncbi:PREDICTED: acyl-CoA synthetase family member 4 [Dinoponera quadriceps]|uniref:Acyl-CoA synthetase family member 4 n=1 Tax=Dinoponera quadriceps TaxID=609295 RepID=A0A6P3WVW0_DINQU|nr:PREDICTED: acyl-CoA synthetase family member 4 [Dinoponera quadriceps]
MSCTINYTKKLKVQDVKNKYCPYILHNICNWFYLDKPAIEYHDLQEVKIISYNELQAATKTVSDCLKYIQYPEFIGINFDILEYCVPSLMLGILDNGNAFLNVPSDIQICRNIFDSLHIRYIFAKCVTSDREVVRQLNVHGQSVYLTKLIDVPESTVSGRKWHRFAYAIATSGSTGSPKIVKILHSCVLPNITDLRRILDMTEHDKIAQLTNFTFDPCIVEIFLSLSCAATLFMVSKQLKNDTDRLLEKIFCARVTVLQITPSLLFHKWSTERLKATILNKDSHLRVLLLGGEPFPNIKLLSEASHSQNKTRLFNIYGITEVSCWSSINEIFRNKGTDESCIGEPLSETMFQVRNEDNEIVTKGKGFLYIGSSSRICIVGDETEDDLCKPVFRDTGDIISIDDHGRMLYRGRRNNVVKRFGNKINLRELERVVMELSFIRNCAALWDTESHKLYLCLSAVNMKELIDLKNYIISHLRILPAIYKPDKIIVLEKFYFTTSGKICLSSLRKACKESEMEVTSINDVYTDVCEIFGNLWSQHVKSKDVGFLTSGGTSITALQVSNATIGIFKVEFPELIGMLLKNLTFNECVNYIKTTLTNQDWNRTLNHCIAVSHDDKAQNNNCDTEKCIMEEPVSNNFSVLTDQNNSYQCKCRGRTDGNASTQKQIIKLSSVNISTIEVAATYNLQKCVDASPTVYCYSASELFATVGSHAGIIYTVNLVGKNSRPYELKLPDRIEASVLVLADFRGIVGCYDGYIYCIHLKIGEVIWKFQTQDMVKCTAITCAQKSKIFVGSYDHYVYCLSVENGAQIWKIEASQGGICATGCLHPQSTSVLFGTLDGACLALRQFSGRVKWRRKLQDPIFVAPVVLQNGYALFCSVAGTLCCFDIETDCRIWRYEIRGNVFSYPVINTRVSAGNSEHVILASHNKHLYCLEMPGEKGENPRLRYALQLHSSIFATPWCEDKHVFVACTDGTFQVLDLSEGKSLVTKRLPGEIFSSPVIHNDLAILGCRDNNLYVLKLG